ncbi:HIT family hydrolase, diadenosine tetraphosphate hydrolase [Candidatus Desulfofervidus auxilii]|uniref:HIT family hydrolase, diadenosine tetraphosphate hydrolase n=1 Tax=Desulfofervidus auxilii TaxID=1621989 RepID=A0A7U4QIQ8_DESA2|nr:HIT family protein [Candidatus Desulfofervidus auxilii]AMM40103.1 HIT family hydrolase, diadenosine tetraphosphate hydrolase [Candidatus Desulfofervidus auxilii]CAD7779593.1 MAG: Protein hit [Candidatus Methanoperedenaceae archaeon GB50]
MGDCIFCKIIQGEIPATKVYEDEKVLAFMDINPLNDGHTLIVPKRHAETIFEIDPQDLIATIKVAQKLAIAIKKALDSDGMIVVQLNNKAAGQMVPHLHIHLIPRWENDGLQIGKWEMKPGDMEKIKDIAEKIKKEVG